MSVRPQPSFNGQCGVSCIAVSEKNDRIAYLTAKELVVRKISDKKILYQNQGYYASEMHFIGKNLMIFDQYHFTLLNWETNEILLKGDGLLFSNLEYYLTYQNETFQLISIQGNKVLWKKKTGSRFFFR